MRVADSIEDNNPFPGLTDSLDFAQASPDSRIIATAIAMTNNAEGLGNRILAGLEGIAAAISEEEEER
jgi:hypothetical protein